MRVCYTKFQYLYMYSKVAIGSLLLVDGEKNGHERLQKFVRDITGVKKWGCQTDVHGLLLSGVSPGKV